MSQHSVGRTRMINLPAELGWISKHLPLGPRPSGCALGLRALGQVFTDPPSFCWQVYPNLGRKLESLFLTAAVNLDYRVLQQRARGGLSKLLNYQGNCISFKIGHGLLYYNIYIQNYSILYFKKTFKIPIKLII